MKDLPILRLLVGFIMCYFIYQETGGVTTAFCVFLILGDALESLTDNLKSK